SSRGCELQLAAPIALAGYAREYPHLVDRIGYLNHTFRRFRVGLLLSSRCSRSQLRKTLLCLYDHFIDLMFRGRFHRSLKRLLSLLISTEDAVAVAKVAEVVCFKSGRKIRRLQFATVLLEYRLAAVERRDFKQVDQRYIARELFVRSGGEHQVGVASGIEQTQVEERGRNVSERTIFCDIALEGAERLVRVAHSTLDVPALTRHCTAVLQRKRADLR